MCVEELTEDEDAHRILSNPRWLRRVVRDLKRHLNMRDVIGRRGGVMCECTYGVQHRYVGSLCLTLMVTKEHPRQGSLAVAGAVICSVSPLLLCLTLPINCDLQPHQSSSNGKERGSEWI